MIISITIVIVVILIRINSTIVIIILVSLRIIVSISAVRITIFSNVNADLRQLNRDIAAHQRQAGEVEIRRTVHGQNDTQLPRGSVAGRERGTYHHFERWRSRPRLGKQGRPDQTHIYIH